MLSTTTFLTLAFFASSSLAAIPASWEDEVGPVPRMECSCICSTEDESQKVTEWMADEIIKSGKGEADNYFGKSPEGWLTLLPAELALPDLKKPNGPELFVAEMITMCGKAPNANCKDAMCDMVTAATTKRTRVDKASKHSRRRRL